MNRQDINTEFLFSVDTDKMPKIKGIVIHNTAGGTSARSHAQRVYNQNWQQRQNGFTHYWVDAENIYQIYDDEFVAWHTANYDGNTHYIGIEIVDGMDEENFLKAEQKTFELAARLANEYNLPANPIRLHREFVATSCPKRSADIHGGYDAVKNYFNEQVEKYRGNSTGGGSNAPQNNNDDWNIYANVNELNTPLNNGLIQTGYIFQGRDTRNKKFVWSEQKHLNPGMNTFVKAKTSSWTPGSGDGLGSELGKVKYKKVDYFVGEDGKNYDVSNDDLWIVSHVNGVDQFSIEKI